MTAGGSTLIFIRCTSKRANWPDSADPCVEREMQRYFGETWSEVLKSVSKIVGVACPAFSCSQDGDLTELCHGDD